MPTLCRTLLAVALCLLEVGCATPEAVRAFARSARDVTAQFPPFVDDLAGSCVRRKLADSKVTDIEDETGPATTACKEDFALAPDLLATMDVLTRYLNALYRLSSNESVQFDREIDAFAGRLQASARLPAPATNAVRGLAKFIANAAASGYQRKKLAEAVTKANADVAVLTNALGRIVGVEYVRDLRNEEASLHLRYGLAMKSVGNNDGVALLLQRKWREDLEKLQRRRAAATAYQKALERVRDGHKQLAVAATKWSTKELATQLEPFTTSLQGLVNSFSIAFF